MGESASTKPYTVRHDAEGRVVRYEAPADSVLAGVWVEIRAIATGGQLRALLSRNYWSDILDWAAPRVVAWQVPGEEVVERVLPAGGGLPERTVQDVEPASVPPPAEAGAQAFAAVVLPGGDVLPLWRWVRACLIASAYHRDGPDAPETPAVPEPPPEEDGGADEGKASSGRSDDTPAGTPSGSSDEASETTTTSKRKSGRTSRGS